MAREIAEIAAHVQPGKPFAVRVQPKARREAVTLADGRIRVLTTAAPEAGKANKAVTRLLARALGVAPSRLTLLAGETARDKLFRLD
ncbi:hypothetical protein SAMN05216257_101680 [Meinhardsimonia xiamenensis]|jgi:uncharacterized protein YggU (UPF0235/DUF167 family)|uniref:UPF0235 protein SAMN05216257_101680 n=1 Tax=Meinhardsimonia xiamenensis TaxID=990712 RepID=A0A1G8ZD59_9RHOB|nr:DUF167 domain-containing protein [Meinhardsimonia xiamenensis]PRX37655.1 hypothetical protein LV81_01435 [Meinhardsimonia xiamenensis]SDK12958.1 hypothetical protein SAMN05216257_101680 [Meinhardsimonia xiamenensis]